jgi:hypothetical protein
MSKFNVYEKDFLWIILELFENFETKRTQNLHPSIVTLHFLKIVLP